MGRGRGRVLHMVQGDGAGILDGQTIAHRWLSVSGGRRLGRGSITERERKYEHTRERERKHRERG